MIQETRRQEAEKNFKRYLEEGLIKKAKNQTAQKIFLQNAHDSLRASQLLLDNNIPLWTIVSAYYSMFYMANATLLAYHYKVGDKIVHKVTADALIHIIRPKLKKKLFDNYEDVRKEAMSIAEIRSDELIQNFDYERNKRNTIQYQTTKEDITQKANTSLIRAKEFLFEMEKLL